jgi:hypothetical protein
MHGQLSSPLARLLVILSASVLALGSLTVVPPALRPADRVKAADGCELQSANRQIQHVIYLQFDNTHFLRDNPERTLRP